MTLGKNTMTTNVQRKLPFLALCSGVFFSTVLLTGCLSGSDGSDGSDGADGAAGADGTDGEPAGPVIANISTVGAPILPGGQVQVSVSASSPSGEPLSYEWNIPDGWTGDDSGDSLLVVTAPEDQAAKAELSVEVSDGERTRSAHVMLATRGPAIEDWSADVPDDEPLGPGDTLALTVDAYNQDGTALRHHPTIGGKRFADRADTWSWFITPRAMGGIYRWESVVEDPSGLTARAGQNVSIQGASAWPAYGGNRQRSGHTISPNADTAEGDIRWDRDAGLNLAYLAVNRTTLGADDSVYVVERRGALAALDAADGARTVIFDSDSTSNRISNAVAVGADGTLYAGTLDGRVLAIDPDPDMEPEENYRVIYQADDEITTSPAIGADGTVFVGSSNHSVYALNPDNDKKSWRFAADDQIHEGPALGPDGTVYVGSDDGHVYALSRDTGEPAWQFETDDSLGSSPVVSGDNRVYVVSDAPTVYALDAVDGSKHWSHEFPQGSGSTPALSADNATLYVMPSSHDTLYALHTADGTESWRHTGLDTPSGDDRALRISPTLGADGTVYLADTDDLWALNPDTGNIIWREDSPGAGTPAVGSDGTVYVVQAEFISPVAIAVE